VPRAELSPHERAGDPRTLGPPRMRHALSNRRPRYQPAPAYLDFDPHGFI